jgi:Cu(I)/Ag(I) efflux system membrane fusion protein
MNKGTILLGIAGLAVGLMSGYVLFSPGNETAASLEASAKQPLFYRSPMNPEVTSPVPAKDSMGMDYVPVYAETPTAERKILFYRNPMNPSVTSPVPATDSMGMDYVPVYADGDAEAVVGTVKIDPVIRNNIGLRTAVAELKAMSRTIRAVGRVDYDEEKLVRLHPKVDGWIRQIRVDKTGQPVENDEILLSIYSPKLVSTQQEYLLALKNLDALKHSPFDDIREGAEALARSSRERLVLLDVPEHQIVELEETLQVKESLHIHAPSGGTVLKIGARQDQYVIPGTQLYLIADLSKVWVYADIYEYELPLVQVGDRVEMSLASSPGRTFEGQISYIYPYAEAKTRTTKVRLVFDNPDLLLRPEMFAEVSIKAAEQPDQVVVPSEAVVRSGDYDQIFVVTPGGKFEPRKVRLGIESSGEVAVLSGVERGENVVVSAQFLIDSESKLREATAKMMDPGIESTETSRDGYEAMDISHGSMGSMDDSMNMEHESHEPSDHSENGGMSHEMPDQSDHSGSSHEMPEEAGHSSKSHEDMNHD